ncbi:MAG TPA: hypothetical protein VF798_05060, partial [Burkholderiaceae bacterium]
LWISIAFAALLAHGVLHGMLLWPALSGGAMLLQRLSTAKDEPEHADNDAPAISIEDERASRPWAA